MPPCQAPTDLPGAEVAKLQAKLRAQRGDSKKKSRPKSDPIQFFSDRQECIQQSGSWGHGMWRQRAKVLATRSEGLLLLLPVFLCTSIFSCSQTTHLLCAHSDEHGNFWLPIPPRAARRTVLSLPTATTWLPREGTPRPVGMRQSHR